MTEPNYYDYVMSHARLAVLRALSGQPTGTLNDSLIATAMGELGLPITREQLRQQIAWLEEHGLVRISRPTDTLMVVALRERGMEVALGRVVVEGVQRPSLAR